MARVLGDSAQKDGAEVFAAFILMVELAAKMPERGILEDSDGPLTFEDMSIKTGFQKKLFENACKVLCDKMIGWMDREEVGDTHEVSKDTRGVSKDTSEVSKDTFGIGVLEERRGEESRREEKTLCSADAELPVGFSQFWKEWPRHFRKTGRSNCLKAWDKGNLETQADEIIAGVKRHKESEAWARDKGQFIPMPLTWLNRQGWETPINEDASGEFGPGSPRRELTADEIALIDGGSNE